MRHSSGTILAMYYGVGKDNASDGRLTDPCVDKEHNKNVRDCQRHFHKWLLLTPALFLIFCTLMVTVYFLMTCDNATQRTRSKEVVSSAAAVVAV